jgi:hypothetical protein
MAEFDQLRPKLLGYMFDILVEVLRVKHCIQFKNLPRMADFAVWGEAITRAIGYREMEFINVYYDNIGKQNIEAIEAHPLGQAIAKFCEQLEEKEAEEGYIKWEGSPNELLEQLRPITEQYKIDTTQRLWPKTPSSLSRRLNQVRSNFLEGLGISVNISRITSTPATSTNGSRRRKINTSTIRIEKIPPVSPIPPVSEDHEENQAKNAEGISSVGGIISAVNKMPPVQNTEKHAQKSEWRHWRYWRHFGYR